MPLFAKLVKPTANYNVFNCGSQSQKTMWLHIASAKLISKEPLSLSLLRAMLYQALAFITQTWCKAENTLTYISIVAIILNLP